MNEYEKESLLRPPVEYYASANYAIVGVVAAMAPEVFMMLPSVALTLSLFMFGMSLRRFLQGRKITNYQNGLWKLPIYMLSSSKIPVSKKQMFLGRGFKWEKRHTQRLADIQKSDTYGRPSKFYMWSRQFVFHHEETWVLNYVANFLSSQSRLNPVKPLPPVGGVPTLHAVGMLEGEEDIFYDIRERVGHALILGTTRVGKSRAAEVFITQDIRRGDVVIVFDPKSDANLFRRCYVEARNAGRLDNFYAFHLGAPEVSARYSPIANFSRVTEIATRIARNLPGSGQSQAFREFVWRLVNNIAKALTALGIKSDYTLIKEYGENIEPLLDKYLTHVLEQKNYKNGTWKKDVARRTSMFKSGDSKKGKLSDRTDHAMALFEYFRDEDIKDDVAQSLMMTFGYEKNYLDKLVGSLLPLMEKLCTGSTAELLSPDYLNVDDERPIFSWPEVIRTGGIVYVGLSALVDPEVASTVGNSMFADLTGYSGRIYQSGVSQGLPMQGTKRNISIHADEFNEIIGDEFIPMLNKSGGSGFQVNAYTQTSSDVSVVFDKAQKAGQVFGNFNTVIMFRVRDIETAELLTKSLKPVEINQLTAISGSTDTPSNASGVHFTSNVQQRMTSLYVDLIHPADLTQLPKGQAFALLEGAIPYKIRFPLPDERDLDEVPIHVNQIAAKLLKNYSTSEDWCVFTESFDTSFYEATLPGAVVEPGAMTS